MKRMSRLIMCLVMISMIGCALPLSRPWYKNKATVYFEQNPVRAEFQADVFGGVLSQGMNMEEVKLTVYINDHNDAIQKHNGVYNNFSGAYWFVGWYDSDAFFHYSYVIFFEDGKVTGWID